jgi:hypothetical protein
LAELDASVKSLNLIQITVYKPSHYIGVVGTPLKNLQFVTLKSQHKFSSA